MDLNNIRMNIDTQIVYNVGYPLKSSNAPIVYNSLFAARGMNMLMLPVEVEKGRIPELMAACRLLNIRYLCPTMPHKGDFVDAVDDVDPDSRIFGSVNLVKTDENGVTHGAGYDGRGTVNALIESGAQLCGATVMLIGAGGICGVIALELSKKGVKELHILNRTPEKAQAIADKVNAHTAMRAYAHPQTAEELASCAGIADIVIQATPRGMKGNPNDYEDLSFIDELPGHATVLDCVLNPPCTKFRRKAKDRGLKTIPGSQMLLCQMTDIFRYMWNEEITKEDREYARRNLFIHLGLDPDAAED